MTPDDEIDDEIEQHDRTAALAAMADDVLFALDLEREQEYERVEAATIRQLADLEREGATPMQCYADSVSARTTCRSCGAAIVWVALTSGSRMPFNADTFASHEATGFLWPPPRPLLDIAPSSVSHFATCPKAAQHRSK